MINNQTTLDRMFHALADGHRRSIIERLASGPLTVSDLAGPLHISLPAVMQHIAVLETSGLLVSEKQGRVRTCTLASGALTPAETWINARRSMVQRRMQRLEQFLVKDQEDQE